MTFPPTHLIEAHAAGALDSGGTVRLMQSLVDCGLAWKLSGYRAEAEALIAQGLVTRANPRRTFE